MHGLRATIAQVDDGEAAVGKANATVWGPPYPSAVGASGLHVISYGKEPTFGPTLEAICIDRAGNAAHQARDSSSWASRCGQLAH
jgi:hypothetical protein